jgi:hypothetical protein
MRKYLLALLALALAFAYIPEVSAEVDKGPALKKGGGDMQNMSRIGLGDWPTARSSITLKCVANQAITTGYVVRFGNAVTYPNGVSLTSSLADADVIGVAEETVAAGAAVNVSVLGVTKAMCAVDVTRNMKLIPSATAGLLTNAAAVAEDVYTVLSASARAFTALENKDHTGSNTPVLVWVGK